MRKALVCTAILGLFLVGCGSGEKKNESAQSTPLASSVNESVQGVLEAVGDTASKAIEKADELGALASEKAAELTQKAGELGQNITQKASEIGQAATEKASEITAAASEKAVEIKSAVSQTADNVASSIANKTSEALQKANTTANKASQKVDNVVEAVKAPVFNADNGKKVFAKCVACHGKAANLKALNASQDISKWDKENIFQVLKGYKAGTYGGNLKVSMTSTVKNLSDDDLNDVAGYITTLGK